MQHVASLIERLQNRRALAITVALAAILTLALALAAARGSFSTQQPQKWVQLSSLFDGTIHALLVEDPNGLRVIYAGTDGGVFRSTDQGKTWSPLNRGLNDRLVRSLAMDPDNPNVLYAGTWSGRVYMSSDGGQSWQERSTGLQRSAILALAVHTREPQRLYALTGNTVFVTTDRGRSWSPAGEVPEPTAIRPGSPAMDTLRCLAVDPDQPHKLYVGTTGAVYETGIYVSINGGSTWQSLHTGTNPPANLAFTNVAALVLAPRAPGTMYALAQSSDGTMRVFKSEDSGTTWSYADSYRDGTVARCIAVNPKNPLEVYVGLEDGLYKSSDGRKSWFRSQKGLTGPDGAPADVHIVVVDPLEPRTVYACSGNRFFVSEDSGATWRLRSTIQAADQANILALAADPKDGQTFYASVEGGGLFKTTDGGDRWVHVAQTLPAQHMTAIAIDPVNPQIVYVGHREGAVSSMMDGGITVLVTQTAPVSSFPISVLAVDSDKAGRLYAGTAGGGLFRSEDGGRTWKALGAGIGKNIQRLLVNSKEPSTPVYVRGEETAWRSYRGGEEWRPWNPGYGWVDIAPPIKSSVQPFLVTNIPEVSTTVLVDVQVESGDGVKLEPSMVTVLSQPAAAQQADLAAFAVGSAMPEALYSLVQGQGVLLKTNRGAAWTKLGTGLELLPLRALALSADDPDLILVGTSKGVYRYQVEESGWQKTQERWRGFLSQLRRWARRGR